jgi:hypothetical protein
MMRLWLTKNSHLVLALLFVFVFLLSPFCFGQETAQPEITATVDRPAVNINTSFYSQYIWRGYELSHGSFVMFPSVTVSYKGFSVNWWGDIDTDFAGKPAGLQCMEQDYSAWYSNTWKKLNYTLGYIYYNTKTPETQEIWASVGLSMFLNPTLSIYRDIERGDSWYYNFALSHSFPIPKNSVCWKYDLSFDVGEWVSYYWMHNYTKNDVNYSAWHDGNVWVGLKIPLSDVCSITPKIQYSFPLSYKARANLKGASFEGDDADFVYGGLIFDYNF